jgi:hypothetical protein
VSKRAPGIPSALRLAIDSGKAGSPVQWTTNVRALIFGSIRESGTITSCGSPQRTRQAGRRATNDESSALTQWRLCQHSIEFCPILFPKIQNQFVLNGLGLGSYGRLNL